MCYSTQEQVRVIESKPVLVFQSSKWEQMKYLIDTEAPVSACGPVGKAAHAGAVSLAGLVTWQGTHTGAASS